MTKIKTFSATVLLFAAVAAPVFAQDGGVLGSSYGWEPSSSANSGKPGMHSRMRNSDGSGTSNSEMTEPGDFAVTGGLSNRSRARNPTGQVDPGTSNSPAGNAGGE
jgi:hypothetical protein